MLGTINMTSNDFDLLADVAEARCTVYEPVPRLSKILALQNRGLVVLQMEGWRLTQDGRPTVT